MKRSGEWRSLAFVRLGRAFPPALPTLARVRLQRLSPIGNCRNPPPRAENVANRKPGTPNKLPKGERALVKLEQAEREVRVLAAAGKDITTLGKDRLAQLDAARGEPIRSCTAEAGGVAFGCAGAFRIGLQSGVHVACIGPPSALYRPSNGLGFFLICESKISGNRYLRRLLINGASANLLRSKATKADPWGIGLLRRRPPLGLAVGAANK